MTKAFDSTLFDVVMDKGGFDSILASGSVATAEKTSGQIDALLKPNGHFASHIWIQKQSWTQTSHSGAPKR